MAQDSLASAQLLSRHGQIRASASRGYHASYQAVTALLLYQRQSPPDGREAWSHEATPELLKRMSGTVLSLDARKDVALRLAAAYELRVVADYLSAVDLEEAKLKASLKDAGFIIKLVRSILPQDQT
jgi:uncharacterized protein (UPF0332 family)